MDIDLQTVLKEVAVIALLAALALGLYAFSIHDRRPASARYIADPHAYARTPQPAR